MQIGLDDFAAKKELDTKGRRLGRRVAVWKALPDVSEAMLSTGIRIGELLAVSGEEISEDDDGHTTVLIDWRIVRQTGQGVVREPGRKAGVPGVLLRVPGWSAAMWQRRKLAAGTGPAFPSTRGGWLDPSNTINRLHGAFDETGFNWVTSRVWRHSPRRGRPHDHRDRRLVRQHRRCGRAELPQQASQEQEGGHSTRVDQEDLTTNSE